MKARLKRIDTNSEASLESFQPENPECFSCWLNASIGSDEGEGADDFQILVCNRAWLDRQQGSQVDATGQYVLLDGPFDAGLVTQRLEAHLDGCSGDTWVEVVAQISKIGVWEFEGYKR